MTVRYAPRLDHLRLVAAEMLALGQHTRHGWEDAALSGGRGHDELDGVLQVSPSEILRE